MVESVGGEIYPSSDKATDCLFETLIVGAAWLATLLAIGTISIVNIFLLVQTSALVERVLQNASC